jgi:hypothetical protein
MKDSRFSYERGCSGPIAVPEAEKKRENLFPMPRIDHFPDCSAHTVLFYRSSDSCVVLL